MSVVNKWNDRLQLLKEKFSTSTCFFAVCGHSAAHTTVHVGTVKLIGWCLVLQFSSLCILCCGWTPTRHTLQAEPEPACSQWKHLTGKKSITQLKNWRFVLGWMCHAGEAPLQTWSYFIQILLCHQAFQNLPKTRITHFILPVSILQWWNFF